MAFYFALLNVANKKEEKEKEKSHHHHRRHRRHSIASVESPLLDYRLLPRPQLLSDDIVITNDHVEDHLLPTSSSTSHAPLSRRCRGSARASKWVHDNHSSRSRTLDQGIATLQPSTSQIPPQPPPLARSKRMAFGEERERKKERKRGGKEEEVEGRGGSEGRKQMSRRQKSQSHSEDDLEDRGGGKKKKEEEEEEKRRKRERKDGKKEEKERKKDGKGKQKRPESAKKDDIKNPPPSKSKMDSNPTSNSNSTPKPRPAPIFSIGTSSGPRPRPTSGVTTSTSVSRIPVSTSATSKTLQTALQSSFPLTISISSCETSSRQFSPPLPTPQASGVNGLRLKLKQKPINLENYSNPARNPSIFQMMAGSATDESGRSSSQMSNESVTPRRDDSPASSVEEEKEREVAMKLSGISMSSRSSEPRLKKVTFESSPYVISNSFLGDGAGSGVLVMRRNSGTAVRRMPWSSTQNRLLLAPETVEEVSGDDWWTRCGPGAGRMDCEDEEAPGMMTSSQNRMNRCIEKSQQATRSILRCGLIRRRSTSDKSRLLAYRNTGFLSSSQERKSESTSTSRMTVSVDRPKYK